MSGPYGITRTWTYSSTPFYRLVSETHPESGTVQYTQYDNAGVLKQKVDANGTIFQYGHDGNDRLESIAAGGQTTTISYEPGSDNRLTASVNGSLTTMFGWDTAGRLNSRTDLVDGKSFSTTYAHDLKDNLIEITYPDILKKLQAGEELTSEELELVRSEFGTGPQ